MNFLHQNTLILLALQALASNKNKAKIALKLLSVPVRIVLFITIVLLANSKGISRDNSFISQNRVLNTDTVTVNQEKDTITYSAGFLLKESRDSLAIDTTITDTTINSGSARTSPLKDKVIYNAVDSMRVSLRENKLYLFGDAYIKYQDIELKAFYIELDMQNEEVYARGTVDSLGSPIGRPLFTQGAQSFESDSLRYNFKTENGIIFHIVSKQGEGYLHSEKTKRHADEHIHLQDGKYTTCDADHPHFYMALRKGIVIPEDKIVTGLAYMVIADVPIKFIGIPFGFFPNTTTSTSGILMPTYGEEQTRGFFLRDFGWYQVLGDYADLEMRGAVYSKGSWNSTNRLRYTWRYHFSGFFGFDYGLTYDKNDESVAKQKSYKLKWSHRQDQKANPTQNFSANVDFSAGGYDRQYSSNPTDYLNNKTSSSVSYTKQWPNTPFNLSVSANAEQNKQTEAVNLHLPTGSFNMSSIYPFRNKNGKGKLRWWENLSLGYNSSFKNELSTYNDVLFDPATRDSIRSGFSHSIPIGLKNLKIGKIITIGPSLSYEGRVYTRRIEYNNRATFVQEQNKYVEESDTIHDFFYEHAINPSISIIATPKLYGMLVSKKEDSYVEAIRHVLSPSATFSYTPDMSSINNVDYYDTIYKVTNAQRIPIRAYNYYDKELFSPPSARSRSGSLSLALNNNLEMKVRPRNDTTGESKKVVLLDNFDLRATYNPFLESLRWSEVSLNTGTRLFNNKLSITVNAGFSPYSCDSVGNRYNRFYYNESGKPLRFKNISISSGFSLRSAQSNEKGEKESGAEVVPLEEEENEDVYIEDDMDYVPGDVNGTYANFDIPWSLNVRHDFSFSKNGNRKSTLNTAVISGDFSLTSKWKIGASANIDIENKKMQYTTLNIYRDLHCWEMRFGVSPFGDRRYYTFTIQAKGSLLRDLKYEKKPNSYDDY
jgi:lipopolysaccharide assembly outer membrane protein LptD (OstA)